MNHLPRYSSGRRTAKLDVANELPPAFSRDDAEALLVRLRSGDPKARDLIVAGFLRLAAKHACLAAARYDYLRPRPSAEELYSAACVGLVSGATALAEIGHDNVIGYLGVCIDGAILREVEQHQSQHRDEQLPDDMPAAGDDAALVDLWDEIAACCESAADLRIVRLVADGHTFAAIGAQLSMPPSTAHDRLRAIGRRFNERTGRAESILMFSDAAAG